MAASAAASWGSASTNVCFGQFCSFFCVVAMCFFFLSAFWHEFRLYTFPIAILAR